MTVSMIITIGQGPAALAPAGVMSGAVAQMQPRKHRR